jgi:uncharacterized damage-inducible protein DinB
MVRLPDTCASRGGGAGAVRRQAVDVSSANATNGSGIRLRRMALKDGLLAEFDHEMGTTRKLLERVPDDKLSWKPHEKSMSMGGLATHLANLPTWGGTILNEMSFDLAEAPPNLQEKASRAEILKAFDESTKQTRAWLDKSDPELFAMWALKRAGQEMFSLPRVAAFRTFVLYHIVHHRGQLSVYLRLNDVPVPSIYGPSADEG